MPMSHHPQKRCAGPIATPDPMVCPGNPPHRQSHGTASNPARADHRMVIVAKGASGRSKTGSYQTENATVMLSDGFIENHLVEAGYVESSRSRSLAVNSP